MKKKVLYILIFFTVAIAMGVFLADLESKLTSFSESFTNKEAGLSFKYPKYFKIVEDKGWRITIYTEQAKPENNIKIVYAPQDPSNDDRASNTEFLANCQPASVDTLDADGTLIKVYSDNNCRGQMIDTVIDVHPENGMTYDISVFGDIDKPLLYSFLSNLRFTEATMPVESLMPEQP